MARDKLIQVRRDTAANWTSVNPVLAAGEPGFESDTYKIKIGDGSTAWTSLDYFAADSVLNKYDATVAPTANEDSGDGYSVGSVWIDVTGDTPYICVDATLTAAVWVDISGGAAVSNIQTKVLDIVDNTAAPPTEVSGDRYILDSTGASHANWDGAAANDIVEFNGTTWDATTPSDEWTAYVENRGQDITFFSGDSLWQLDHPNTWFPKILEDNADTVNAALINDAITAAAAVVGVVILPAGLFLSRTIEWDPKVQLRGSGKKATRIRGTTAEPLISYLTTTVAPSGNTGSIKNIWLQGGASSGAKVSTAGIKLYQVAFFHFEDIYCQWFDGYAFDLEGVLIGEFDNVDFRECEGGVRAITSTVPLYTQSNDVLFTRCVFNTMAEWAINWDGAALIKAHNCTFEICGTTGVPDSGAMKGTDFQHTADDNIGFIVDSCWAELNEGLFLSIQGAQTVKHIVRSTLNQTSVLSSVITLNGGILSIQDSHIPYAMTITSGNLITQNTVTGTVTLTGTSTHKKYDVQNLMGSTLNLANPNGDNYNYASASSATTYTTTNKVENAFVSCLINASSEPKVQTNTTVTAGSFVTGKTYTILTVGTTDFTLIGAASNTIGVVFVATGAGSGTGTATLNADKIAGATFVASTDMEMIVEVKNNAVRYFFLEL